MTHGVHKNKEEKALKKQMNVKGFFETGLLCSYLLDRLPKIFPLDTLEEFLFDGSFLNFSLPIIFVIMSFLDILRFFGSSLLLIKLLFLNCFLSCEQNLHRKLEAVGNNLSLKFTIARDKRKNWDEEDDRWSVLMAVLLLAVDEALLISIKHWKKDSSDKSKLKKTKIK